MGRRRIEVRIEDYIAYTEKYNTIKLDNGNEIFANGKRGLIRKIFRLNEEEIFNGIETPYNVSHNNDDFIITFDSKSKTKYRIDLFKEHNIYHLGFSIAKTTIDEYHLLTDKQESIDVFNRIIWILKDISSKLDIHEFFIGATADPKKDRIYEYMMKNISNWEKRETTAYPLGWGIYFKLK